AADNSRGCDRGPIHRHSYLGCGPCEPERDGVAAQSACVSICAVRREALWQADGPLSLLPWHSAPWQRLSGSRASILLWSLAPAFSAPCDARGGCPSWTWYLPFASFAPPSSLKPRN